MFVEKREPVTVGGQQNSVPQLRSIIEHRATSDMCQRSASFVHQKIGRRKVPVMAVGSGNRDVNSSLRDAGEPQRKRMDARHDTMTSSADRGSR